MKKRTICITTPGRLACNPRVVKEADALHEAGYDVVVVSGVLGPLGDEEEQALLADRPWGKQVRRIAPAGPGWFLRRAMTRACRMLTARIPALRRPLAECRHSPLIPSLRRVAEEIPADLHIAHYIAGLAACGPVARRKGSLLGFDAEDAHHLEMTASGGEQLAELDARRRIQAKWLSRCSHLTSAAPLISESYRQEYGVEMTTVLNVFPRSDAPTEVPDPPRQPNLYWFSQKLGPGRGLEEVLDILGGIGCSVTLTLRGVCSPAYREALRDHAGPVALEFLPPAKPDEMVGLASGYTAGLCVELPEPPHHDLCLANKIFTYLSAGIPVILSRTRAHETIARELGEAAMLIDFDNPGQETARLAGLLCEGPSLLAARKAALDLGRSRYCWEVEKEQFLQSVETALSGGTR